MAIRALFSALFARPAPPAFTPNLPGGETAVLAAEMQACLNRTGGTLATARRTEALAGLFAGLSPTGKERYVETLQSLDAASGRSVADRYSDIEEAELFGRPSSKLAMLDAFETPVRRMLAALHGTKNGIALIGEIATFADGDLKIKTEELLTKTDS